LLELIERKIKPQENFLCDILDIFGPGNQTCNRAQNPLPIGHYNFVEGGAIALLRPLNQLEIYQHARPSAPAYGTLSCSVWKGVPALRQVTSLWLEKQNLTRDKALESGRSACPP